MTATGPVSLRAHHLLCLRAFVGLGYSREFSLNMGEIKRRLDNQPGTPVRLIDGPDDICAACPHLANKVCELPGAEAQSRDRDNAVLQLIGAELGHEAAWEMWEEQARALSEDEVNEVCQGCMWEPLGLCKKELIPGSPSE